MQKMMMISRSISFFPSFQLIDEFKQIQREENNKENKGVEGG